MHCLRLAAACKWLTGVRTSARFLDTGILESASGAAKPWNACGRIARKWNNLHTSPISKGTSVEISIHYDIMIETLGKTSVIVTNIILNELIILSSSTVSVCSSASSCVCDRCHSAIRHSALFIFA